MPRGGVIFELERFGWTDGAPILEVAGRWRGPRARRLGAATLVVVGAERRRLSPSTGTGHARADPEPELWRAEFLWTGSGGVEGAELEVGPSLVIELPAPDGAAPPPASAAAAVVEDPLRLELEGLRRQAEADRAEAERLREAVAPLRRDAEALAAAQAELEAARGELRRLESNASKFDASLAAARKDADARELRAVSAGDKRVEQLERDSGGRAAAAEAQEREAAQERDEARAELERLEQERTLVREDAERLARERDTAAADAARMGRERDAAAADVARMSRELATARRTAPGRAESRPAPAAAPTVADPPLFALPKEPEPEPEPTVTLDEPPPEPEPTVTLDEPPPEPEPTVTLDELPPVRPAEPDADRTVRLGPPLALAPRSRQGRPRLQPHRTPPSPRRLADRPPKDSTALRAIAGGFVLLLAIVLLFVLLTVV